MLVLSRKVSQSILIDDDTLIVITEFRHQHGNANVRLGVITSRQRRVLRGELIFPGDQEYERFVKRNLFNGDFGQVGLPKPLEAAYDLAVEGPPARDLAGEE